MLPLWEGFDEYAHFARFSQSALPSSSEPMTREIEETFHLAPLPDQLAWMGPFVRIHPQWRALPEKERDSRVSRLAALPPSEAHQPSLDHYDSYEAQQPPLYYWLLSIPMRLLAGFHLLNRVLILRLLSVLIASFAIPFTYLSAASLVGRNTAFVAAALLAVSPMFAIDAARVANDCLAISLTAVLLCLLVRPRTVWWQLGIALGAALLSKAFLLALVPAVVIVWRKRPGDLMKAVGLAMVVAGWWYVRNLFVVGKLTGWEDDAPLRVLAVNVFHVDWPHAAGSVFKSALWFGGWSFLTVKAWIYNLLLLILFSCALLALRYRSNLQAPLWICFWFLCAMVYDVTAEFTVQHISGSTGWYLWAVCSAFSIVLAAGAGRFGPLLIMLLAALDLYTSNFILMPYYSGLAAHGRSFAHILQVFDALPRLRVPLTLWSACVLATWAIPALRYTKRQS